MKTLIDLADKVGNTLIVFVCFSLVTGLIEVILNVEGFEITFKLATPFSLVLTV